MATWKQLCDGWGITRVPREYEKELCCSMCTRTRPLYTDQSTALPKAITVNGYRREFYDRLSVMRNRTFCRYHAEQFFQET